MEILEGRRKQKEHNFDRQDEVRANKLKRMKSKGETNMSK